MKQQKMSGGLRVLSVVALSAVTVTFGIGHKRAAIAQDEWQIVHWHSNAPRRAPSPAASPSPRP